MSKTKVKPNAARIQDSFTRSKFDPSESRKARYERIYRRVMMETCLNRFKWVGMPKTIDLRFLELTLYRYGLSVFYFDSDYDVFMALQGSGGGAWNMYDNPTTFTVVGNSIVSKTLKAGECVPIWANYSRSPDIDIVDTYASRLAEIDTTIDVNILSARHPFIVSVDASERLSMVNAFRKVQEGEPVIFGTNALSPTALAEKMAVFNVGPDKDIVTNILDARVRVMNDALSLLGIMNVNSQKKERMVVEEAVGAEGEVLASRNIALNARQTACELINERYGLDVSVEWNLDSAGFGSVIGGENVGTLHGITE